MAKDAFGAPVIREVDGHDIRVSNPAKPYFPEASGGPITKLEVIDYYTAVGEVMLRALRDRPDHPGALARGSRARVPGSAPARASRGRRSTRSACPTGAPDWVRTARIAFPSGRTADALKVTHPSAIVWAAQMGTVTLHPWAVRCRRHEHPDELRIDLDPQPGTGFVEADRRGRVSNPARRARSGCLSEDLGWSRRARLPANRTDWDFIAVRRAGIALGRELERRLPGLVTTSWWKEERGTRIFIDFNQNARDRTIAPRTRCAALRSPPCQRR